MNGSDYECSRGFHVFDTESRSMVKVENPNRIFHKIDYDDRDMNIDDVASLDLAPLKNCFIKVIVKHRTNAYLYDMFMNRLTEAGAADVKSIDDSLNFESTGVNEILDESKDTKEILHNYIDSIKTSVDTGTVKSIMDELYLEAINLP
jgi:hypothetical protein